MGDGRKRFSVGFFVVVEIDAHDESDAAAGAMLATNWPWSRQDEPVVVTSPPRHQPAIASIVSSKVLMTSVCPD